MDANFVRGMTTFDLATMHPNGEHALIIAGGQGYVVDPRSEELKEVFGGAIVMAFAHPTRNASVVNHQNLAFEAVGPNGRVWKSRRISWDGFRAVQVDDGVVKGEAWRPADTWHAFTVDLETGDVVGGSYSDTR